jgi:hypothetical protein
MLWGQIQCYLNRRWPQIRGLIIKSIFSSTSTKKLKLILMCYIISPESANTRAYGQCFTPLHLSSALGRKMFWIINKILTSDDLLSSQGHMLLQIPQLIGKHSGLIKWIIKRIVKLMKIESFKLPVPFIYFKHNAYVPDALQQLFYKNVWISGTGKMKDIFRISN